MADWHVARLQKWRHSGFTLDAGEAPIAADDAAGRRRLAEYLLRAPFSLEKITYNPATGSVLHRSDRHWRTKRNFEVFSATEFIAALLAQIPAKGSAPGPLLRVVQQQKPRAAPAKGSGQCGNDLPAAPAPSAP